MITVKLQRQYTVAEDLTSYRTVLTVTSAIGVTTKIFVKQRSNNPLKGVEDVFAAVATPVQLEDLPEDAPDTASSYFRTNIVDLVVNCASDMSELVDEVLADINKLLSDLENLAALDSSVDYIITASAITIDDGSCPPSSSSSSSS